MRKRVIILGSTGSIGTQSLEVISKLTQSVEIVGLSAGRNKDLFIKQLELFKPAYACVEEEQTAIELAKMFKNTTFLFGEKGLLELVTAEKIDLLLVAVSGKIGLAPTLKAIENNIDIALANKETLVMAGDIVMKMAKEHRVNILPVDSEHSAIFQSISNKENLKFVKHLIITASGGPFRKFTKEEIANADVSQALAHPKWNMGKKITVDSATLMNKGLEVIEAHHLFGMDYDNIKVVIHPQSVIHSAIEYNDGSVIAQLGVPSMHIPIQYAITYPQRCEGIKTESFDFIKIARLDFEEPDMTRFPCLKFAIEAGKKGGLYPVALNAANEEAVFAFLKNKIKLNQISLTIEKMLQNVPDIKNPTIEEIFAFDFEIRKKTNTTLVYL